MKCKTGFQLQWYMHISGRLVEIVLQISFVILFQISLKTCSLCSIVFLCCSFYHYSLFTILLLKVIFHTNVALCSCVFILGIMQTLHTQGSAYIVHIAA